jgi:hypothetical protein
MNKKAAGLVFLLILAAPAAAEPAAAPQRYDIELVIFEQPGEGLGEHWPEEPGEPDRSAAWGALTGRGALPKGGSLLDRQAMQMGPVAFTLKRRGASVLLHTAWRQQLADRDSPTWLWIRSGRLRGLVRLSRGRFLHLDTDLLLESAHPQAANSPRAYRVRLHRKMRRDETHYLDHPKIGIIVKVVRQEAPVRDVIGGPAASTPETAAEEPIGGPDIPLTAPTPGTN